MTEASHKPGRNDPCPCGSGKKYKQCCLQQQSLVQPEEYLWRRMRRAIEDLPADLLNFAATRYGRDALHEAWDEFTSWQDVAFDPQSPHIPVFMPWFYFDWLPDSEHTRVPPSALDGLTLGAAYLERKGKQLDPLRARYIEQCCASPFSFYDLVSVRPGEGFVMRDIFLGEEIDVTERTASRTAAAGDILFAKVVRFDDLAMIEACAPVAFPPVEKAALLDLRKAMRGGRRKLTVRDLREWDAELLELYYDIAERLLHPGLPELKNTDGEPLLFHRLVFDIVSPRAAFDALKHLCSTETEEELLATAERDAGGELWRIEFPWLRAGKGIHAASGDTVLGTVIIEGFRLSIEVNSERRAAAARALVEKHLPEARHQTTVIESPQAMLTRSKQEGAPRQPSEADDLNALPEVQAHLAQMMREHYRKWLHEKIPALNGKTPPQAVKTRDGREMVEALVLQIERDGRRQRPPLDPAIVAELRKALGLA